MRPLNWPTCSASDFSSIPRSKPTAFQAVGFQRLLGSVPARKQAVRTLGSPRLRGPQRLDVCKLFACAARKPRLLQATFSRNRTYRLSVGSRLGGSRPWYLDYARSSSKNHLTVVIDRDRSLWVPQCWLQRAGYKRLCRGPVIPDLGQLVQAGLPLGRSHGVGQPGFPVTVWSGITSEWAVTRERHLGNERRARARKRARQDESSSALR